MSDDYDDQDEPGGLWDPDAFNPTPAPTRPALHIVATPGTPNPLRPPADATPDFEAADEHTLVRLEQFKPAGDTTRQHSSHTRPALTRRAAATGIVAIAVAATAIGYTLVSHVERPGRPALTQHQGSHVAADAEQAAATRTVASASSAARDERPPTSRAQHHTSPRHPVTGSPKDPATSQQHVPADTAPRATTPTKIVRPVAPNPRPQASAATASSEFGFEG